MRLVNILAAAVVVIAVPGMAAAAPRAAWTVRDPVIRPGPQGGTTAAYMTLINDAPRPLRLAGVDCGCAEMTMTHRSSEANGMAHMAPAGDVIVPPKGEVKFAPGALHLMVMGLKRSLRPGDSVQMTLRFEGAKPLVVAFPVRR